MRFEPSSFSGGTSSLGLSCAEPDSCKGEYESRGEMLTRGTGREGSEFPALRDAEPMASPGAEAGFALFALLMKIPSGLWPPLPAADTPFVPTPSEAAPGAPGCDPSGEIEPRAERFPAGTAGGGATSAGVAESAINVLASPAGCCANSGTAAFVSPLWRAECGADMGLTGRDGLSGACADEAMLISPACFSGVDISGSAGYGGTPRGGGFV